MPCLIDSHCHFDDDRFAPDRDKVYRRAVDNGVSAMVVPAVTRARWAGIEALSSNYSNVFATAGLHPAFCSEHRKQDLDALEQQLTGSGSVAIGECGLDGFISPAHFTAQQFYFSAQLDLAKQYSLPVIIHARQAVEQVILTLKKHQLTNPSGNGVIHSYNGSLQQAHTLIDMGYLVSFGGSITYPRAKKLHSLVKQLPLDSIMLETDAPDQPAVGQQGERNEPACLTQVLAAAARIRNQSPSLIANAANDNAKRLFNLPLKGLNDE